ncbi:MAG TPA: hypothetical protein VJ770_27940 [Stellaceae bacterium]|nr:hypothetical protein [Stellaceae bacterium]
MRATLAAAAALLLAAHIGGASAPSLGERVLAQFHRLCVRHHWKPTNVSIIAQIYPGVYFLMDSKNWRMQSRTVDAWGELGDIDKGIREFKRKEALASQQR